MVSETRFKDLLARVSFPGLTLELTCEAYRYFLRWANTNATCNHTNEPFDSKGRKWRLSPYMTDGEVVATAWLALLTYQEHEAREQFTFDGVSVYDSHIDVHELVRLRKDHPTGGLKERTPGRPPIDRELPEGCHP